MRFAAAGVLCVCCGWAQQASRESQNHPVYEDTRVRILEFQMRPHEPAAPNRYDTDFVWVNGTEIHFSRANVLHAERNNEVIAELLQPQTGPRNVCAQVLEGQYLHCHEPGSEWIGVDLQIQFETDQTRIGILRIAPSGTLSVPPADVPPLLIPLEGTEAEVVSHLNGGNSSSRRTLKAVDILRSPADQVTEVRNTGKTTARFLVVEFGGAGE